MSASKEALFVDSSASKPVRIWLRLANHSHIEIDENGRFYQVFTIPAGFKPQNHLGRFGCEALCGFRLKRVHLTCLHCRARRVSEGKIVVSSYSSIDEDT